MTCCNNRCRQGRDCPERIERLREAKRLLDSGERECKDHWIQLVLPILAGALVGWAINLIRGALA